MLYIALFPNQTGDIINASFFENTANRLPELLPENDKWNDIVRVIYSDDLDSGKNGVTLIADALEQRVVCYLNEK